jgi:hypothetical protein
VKIEKLHYLKLEENKRHSICEFMKKLDINNEIKHYEQKLRKFMVNTIPLRYANGLP